MDFGMFATLLGTKMWNDYTQQARQVGMKPTYSGYLKYVENRTGILPLKIVNDTEDRDKN